MPDQPDPATPSQITPPSPVQAPPERLWRRPVAIVAAGVLALLGVGAAGYVVGHGAAGADKLERRLAAAQKATEAARGDATAAQSDAESAADDKAALESQVSSLEDEVDNLKESVAAANGLKRDAAQAPSGESDAPDGTHRLGVAAKVGELTLKPVAFSRSGGSGGSATYVVTITAKNDGSEPKGIFCGGSGASLTDAAGRSFDGDSVLGNGSASCGDDLGPGLTATYKMRFKLPSGAKPAFVTLSDDSLDFGADDEGGTWFVK